VSAATEDVISTLRAECHFYLAPTTKLTSIAKSDSAFYPATSLKHGPQNISTRRPRTR
jgi:hypothetical protein